MSDIRIRNQTQDRFAEISKNLVRSTTASAALARLDSSDDGVIPPTWKSRLATTLFFGLTGLWLIVLFWRLVDGPRRTSAQHLATWLEGKDLRSCELWEFDSGSECGYALLRNGDVKDFWLYCDYQATDCGR
ncbi:hypothetical protein Poly51_60770 [Rubripirellula tenax]|uniref:Uncharacterized protein n=1 Tax=Rubripirellula tenax TaxID=2528015 RepID=A0A5C6E9T2_9BACT|nr:hypothetical protein Poly51_60770 [Rubripirellula tenax]